MAYLKMNTHIKAQGIIVIGLKRQPAKTKKLNKINFKFDFKKYLF